MASRITEKRPNFLLAAGCGLCFFLGIETGGFQLALMRLAEYFSLSPAMMGVLVTAQYAAITLGPICLGPLGDRIGKKPLLVISVPVFIAGCLLTAASPTVPFFLVSVFILGAAYSVCESTISSAIADTFPERQSRYLTMTQCGFSLGAVISPQVYSRLGFFSWRLAFITPALGFLLLYPLLILARCKKPEAASSGGFAGLFRKPLLWILIFAMISYLVMESGLAFFANSFFIWEYSSAILGAWSISVFWCAHTVSRLVFALVPVKSRRVVLMGFSVSVLFLLLLMIARNQWISLALFGILGFIMGPVWPMIVGMGAKNFPERSGTAVGFLTASGGLGGIFTPPLIGLISEYQGIHAGFAVLGLFAAAAFFALRFWGKENA